MPEKAQNCQYCSGDKNTQDPLQGTNEKPLSPVLTLITDKKLLSVLEHTEKGYHEVLYQVAFCPMCGRKL